MDIFTRYVISEAVSAITGVDSASLDVEYAKAVESGNTEKAMRMVRDMASRRMPDTKVVDEDGVPSVVYHGTPNPRFTRFESNNGVWVTPDREYAEGYSTKEGTVLSMFADIKNPVMLGNINEDFIPENVEWWSHSMGVDQKELQEWLDSSGYDIECSNVARHEITSNPLFVEWLKELGFDGMCAEEQVDGDVDTWCVFDCSHLKSADITYDDSGNLIPLSKRFDFSNPDIRY